MVMYCCVPHCKSKQGQKNISFFSFPKNDDARRWMHLLNVGKKVTSSMRVCSLHFTAADIKQLNGHKCKNPRLLATALPSRNLPNTLSLKYSSEDRELRKCNEETANEETLMNEQPSNELDFLECLVSAEVGAVCEDSSSAGKNSFEELTERSELVIEDVFAISNQDDENLFEEITDHSEYVSGDVAAVYDQDSFSADEIPFSEITGAVDASRKTVAEQMVELRKLYQNEVEKVNDHRKRQMKLEHIYKVEVRNNNALKRRLNSLQQLYDDSAKTVNRKKRGLHEFQQRNEEPSKRLKQIEEQEPTNCVEETNNLHHSERVRVDVGAVADLMTTNSFEEITVSDEDSITANSTEEITVSDEDLMTANSTEEITVSDEDSITANSTEEITVFDEDLITANSTEKITDGRERASADVGAVCGRDSGTADQNLVEEIAGGRERVSADTGSNHDSLTLGEIPLEIVTDVCEHVGANEVCDQDSSSSADETTLSESTGALRKTAVELLQKLYGNELEKAKGYRKRQMKLEHLYKVEVRNTNALKRNLKSLQQLHDDSVKTVNQQKRRLYELQLRCLQLEQASKSEGVGSFVGTAEDRERRMNELRESCKAQAKKSADRDEKCETLRKENEILGLKVKKQREVAIGLEKKTFSVDVLKNKEDFLSYYTGLKSYAAFDELLNVLVPNLNAKQLIKYVEISHKFLPLADQLLFVLNKLLQNNDFKHFAFLFNRSVSGMCNLFKSWIAYLHQRSLSTTTWPHRDVLNSRTPKNALKQFSKVMALVGCAVIQTEKPNFNQHKQPQQQKSNVLKSVIAVDRGGAILFASQLFDSSIGDEEIVRRSGFLDLLKTKVETGELLPTDEIMGERQFRVEDLITKDGESLILSSIAPTKSKNKTVPKHRFHVEQAVRRVKKYKIVSDVFRLSMLKSVNQIWAVTCMLADMEINLKSQVTV